MTFERTEYPRPQFRRNRWQCLNGQWDFAFDDDHQGEKANWPQAPALDQKIQVPFAYESKASGIGDETHHDTVWYARRFTIPSESKDQETLLHFQASDYVTHVWVNGHYTGNHKGGYTAFSFSITPYLKDAGENQLVVKVVDSKNTEQPRGKQRWVDENFGCWYVQTTGIWQTVWLEFVSKQHLKTVKMTPDIDTSTLGLEYELAGEGNTALSLQTTITYKNDLINQFSFTPTRTKTKLTADVTSDLTEWKVRHWTPEHPHLYDITFTLYDGETVIDEVTSYFGMRKISTDKGQILLNNSPLYQRLLLDQGYWPDTHLTPPSDEAMKDDIEKTLAMGFNGVRKHQKVEDARFLYWCDQMGLLVWSEVGAAYEFSDEAVTSFTEEWLEIVRQQYNHPSIITWVPFNESWGVAQIYSDQKQQKFTEGIYALTKAIDPMRPVVVNDGWEHTISDILTLHDYEELGTAFTERYEQMDRITDNKVSHNHGKFPFAQGYEYKGQPILISEYGGIAFETEKGWGYGNQVADKEAFLSRYHAITEAIRKHPEIVGYCYTQITDVQQEVNGLLTEQREPKVPIEDIKKINRL